MKARGVASPAAWADALSSEFQNPGEEAFDSAQIQVGQPFEADAALSAAHFAQLREMGFHEVALADVKSHVVFLRGHGA